MKFSIQYFFRKCDQFCRKLRIWSHLLKKSLMENFIFCAVTIPTLMDIELDGLCQENHVGLYYCTLTLPVKYNYRYWFKEISLDSTDSIIILFIIIFYMLH